MICSVHFISSLKSKDVHAWRRVAAPSIIPFDCVLTRMKFLRSLLNKKYLSKIFVKVSTKRRIERIGLSQFRNVLYMFHDVWCLSVSPSVNLRGLELQECSMHIYGIQNLISAGQKRHHFFYIIFVRKSYIKCFHTSQHWLRRIMLQTSNKFLARMYIWFKSRRKSFIIRCSLVNLVYI